MLDHTGWPRQRKQATRLELKSEQCDSVDHEFPSSSETAASSMGNLNNVRKRRCSGSATFSSRSSLAWFLRVCLAVKVLWLMVSSVSEAEALQLPTAGVEFSTHKGHTMNTSEQNSMEEDNDNDATYWPPVVVSVAAGGAFVGAAALSATAMYGAAKWFDRRRTVVHPMETGIRVEDFTLMDCHEVMDFTDDF